MDGLVVFTDEMVGNGFTVTVFVDVALQPLDEVAVTV
jgi:hypothetical protein